MITDKELIEKAKELYKKLGGVGNADARIVRGLWERLEGAKNTEQQLQPDTRVENLGTVEFNDGMD